MIDNLLWKHLLKRSILKSVKENIDELKSGKSNILPYVQRIKTERWPSSFPTLNKFHNFLQLSLPFLNLIALWELSN